jgi:hypothetical protein
VEQRVCSVVLTALRALHLCDVDLICAQGCGAILDYGSASVRCFRGQHHGWVRVDVRCTRVRERYGEHTVILLYLPWQVFDHDRKGVISTAEFKRALEAVCTAGVPSPRLELFPSP